jgi:hypothetical protein
VVAFLHAAHSAAHVDDHTGPFVTQDARKEPLWILPGEREVVRMADARRSDLDEHLAVVRALEVDGLDGQGLAGGVCDGGARLHRRERLCARQPLVISSRRRESPKGRLYASGSGAKNTASEVTNQRTRIMTTRNCFVAPLSGIPSKARTASSTEFYLPSVGWKRCKDGTD